MKHGYYIGLMSGTSMDGIDAALVDFQGGRCTLVAAHEHPWPESLAKELQQLARDGHTRLEELGRLDHQCGTLFAEAANQLIDKTGIAPCEIIAIGSHGQTLWHSPDATHPFTLQIGDPNRIVEATGITTVADFRRRDMAAGGQGAPLVPAFHHAMLHDEKQNRVILNIGGIANISVLPAGNMHPEQQESDGIAGFDTGPGNCLLDRWIDKHRNRNHDAGGAWAGSGTIIPELMQDLLSDPYFERLPPKSTGTDYFSLAWLENRSPRVTEYATADVQATLLELTSRTIAGAIRSYAPYTDEIFLCGGGVHNPVLLNRIRTLLAPIPVESTAAEGIPPDWMEAMAFAWLAQQTLAKRPGNLPSATGATHPTVLGGIYSR